MSNFEFEFCEETPAEEDVAAIVDGLTASMRKGVMSRNFKPLAIFLRDTEGKVVAGLQGHTHWEWLQIKLLWVAPHLRSQDIGTRLMREAEERARSRGCRGAVVDTFSFQATGFYEKLGYARFGSVDDFPHEHKRIYFSKLLTR